MEILFGIVIIAAIGGGIYYLYKKKTVTITVHRK